MQTIMKNLESGQLVRGETLLVMLFPIAKERPCLAWLNNLRKRGGIPFVRLGRLIYFDIDQVRKALSNE